MQTPEDRRARRRAYYAENRKEILAQKRASYDPEEASVRNKKWYADHRDYRKEYEIQYKESGKREEVNKRYFSSQKAKDTGKRWRQSPQGKKTLKEDFERRRADPEQRMLMLIKAAKPRAKAHTLNFDGAGLKARFVSVPPKNCACCNVELDYVSHSYSHKRRTPSFDRVDNTKGYTPDNVRVVCFHCNSLKSDATLDELRLLVAYVERELPRGK